MTSPTGPSEETRPRRVARGFSLIELIFVLGVLALGAAMAAPSLSRFSRGRQSLDAAAHLLAVLQYAQNRATVSASAHRVEFDAAGGRYWITSRGASAFTRLPTEFGRDFETPHALAISLDTGPDAASPTAIAFNADGSHEVATVQLREPDGSVTTIGCDTPSEPYRILSGRGSEAAR